MMDQEFPTLPEANPDFETNHVQTFTKTGRFADQQCYYSEYTKNLSVLDCKNLFKGPNCIRKFDKQLLRDDLFLSKA